MADLGLRRSMRGDWGRGLPLLEEAFARNPAQPSAYRYMLFLHHYINGRYQRALAEATKIDAPDVIYTPVTLAMAYGRLGRRQEAAAALRSEEHTSELQSLMRISYAVFCLKNKNNRQNKQ